MVTPFERTETIEHLREIVKAFFSLKKIKANISRYMGEDSNKLSATWRMGEEEITRSIKFVVNPHYLRVSLNGCAWVDIANSGMSRFTSSMHGTCELRNLSETECIIKIALDLEEIYQYVDLLGDNDLIYTASRTNLLRDIREPLRA